MAVDSKEMVPDPDQVAVKHVSGAASAVVNGQTIAMTLVTDRVALSKDGTLTPDLIIAARLRFDLHTARNIRDQLDAHLSGLTAAIGADEKPN